MVSARRAERVLIRVRYLMGLVVLTMTVLFSPASLLVALGVVTVLLAANLVAHRRLDGLRDYTDARALARGHGGRRRRRGGGDLRTVHR